MSKNGIIKPSFGYTATSLIVPQKMSYEGFCESLQTHEFMGESVNWWLGDLLVSGMTQFGEEKVIQAISATRKKPDTLDSYRNVAKSIEPDRRRKELSWSAHREVCHLSPVEQDNKLQDAVTHHLSSRQLRKYARGEAFIDENGQFVESADRPVPQELPSEHPTANKPSSEPDEYEDYEEPTSSTSTEPADKQEAMINQARNELNPVLNQVERFLAILGANGEFDNEIQRMRQYGDMQK